MKIRKAIIPAAGLGTRFLPATKALPKEMLPIVDKPTIQYIVEEAAASGIEDIIIISGRGKRSIEDHFDQSFELEATLQDRDKTDILREVQSISSLANIHYVRQKEAKGLGHAIYCARSFIGKEPFAVLLGDDIVMSGEPALQQLISVYETTKTPVIGLKKVEEEDVSKYGIIETCESPEDTKDICIKGLVEKPRIEDAPSRYAILGRYILYPEIFDILQHLPPGAGGEIQLTDALNILNLSQPITGTLIEGENYDIGNKFGFIKATLDFALKRQDLRRETLEYIGRILDEHQS
ncbi:UTP--glucose-1-phosphate uridylyltransferase GalU [Bacillus lacus]|uniref:UTP--glucose-1-phosphate uridylyltransferase n=1 Tax=Metabacillus lacus TaxID=1983721 RepID=A0A7X2J2D4_9BACI|nr:UTP--glucose-1-phosphate uridylyltransferase GalU [Metabacillus lacus]MRX74192.1 UTP--glucose-1-phosphate uridylyltransferase GalU [Metabacillus lacus]